MVKRDNNLDFIRLCLMSGVVLGHLLALTHVAPIVPVFFPWVGGFLAISGYLITGSMEHSRSYGHFLYKRLLRVGPAFLVALGLGWALGENPVATLQVWASVGLKEPAAPSNGVMWSLAAEEIAYLLLAVAFAVGIYRRAPVPALVAVWLSSLLLPSHAPVNVGHLIALPAYFACGSLLYVLREKIRWSTLSGFAALAAAVLIAGTVPHLTFTTMFGPLVTFVQAPLTAYSLICLGLYAKPRLAPFTNWLGDLSYGGYVYHYPILAYAVHVLHLSTIQAYLIGIPAVAFVSWMSWHTVEERALRLKSRQLRASRAIPAVVNA